MSTLVLLYVIYTIHHTPYTIHHTTEYTIQHTMLYTHLRVDAHLVLAIGPVRWVPQKHQHLCHMPYRVGLIGVFHIEGVGLIGIIHRGIAKAPAPIGVYIIYRGREV
jgi:hypothetical protein